MTGFHLVEALLTKTDYSGLNTGRNSLSGNIFNATRQLPNTLFTTLQTQQVIISTLQLEI
jgi:hypothetical protein